MITAKRFKFDKDNPSANIAEDTGMSGVSIVAIENLGKTSVWIGDPGEGWEIPAGKAFPTPFELGSTDGLDLSTADGDAGLVQVLFTHTA